MSDQAARFHQAADSIEATNRYLKRAAMGAVVALLGVAIAVIVWAALSFRSEVQHIERQQVRFHIDATCQTAALDQVLTELAKAQQAHQHGHPVPPFVYPKPC